AADPQRGGEPEHLLLDLAVIAEPAYALRARHATPARISSTVHCIAASPAAHSKRPSGRRGYSMLSSCESPMGSAAQGPVTNTGTPATSASFAAALMCVTSAHAPFRSSARVRASVDLSRL